MLKQRLERYFELPPLAGRAVDPYLLEGCTDCHGSGGHQTIHVPALNFVMLQLVKRYKIEISIVATYI